MRDAERHHAEISAPEQGVPATHAEGDLAGEDEERLLVGVQVAPHVATRFQDAVGDLHVHGAFGRPDQ
jgi:hypothetical protein